MLDGSAYIRRESNVRLNCGKARHLHPLRLLDDNRVTSEENRVRRGVTTRTQVRDDELVQNGVYVGAS